jgi:hypothetical protein
MNARTIVAWTCALLCCASGALRAQWVQTNGPYYTYPINCMTVSAGAREGARIFAGTKCGILRSADDGRTWKAVNTGLSNPIVLSLASIPDDANGTILFAGTRDGVFLSTNEGEKWIAANEGIRNRSIACMAVVRAPGGEARIFAGSVEGAWLSTNSGKSWTAVNNGLQNDVVLSLTISPDSARGECVFAGTKEHGVCVSADSGKTWTKVPGPLEYETVTCFTSFTTKRGGRTLVAGTAFNSSRIYLSTDRGKTWDVPFGWAGPLSNIWSVMAAAEGTDSATLFAATNQGVYCALISGSVWFRSLGNVDPTSSLAFTQRATGATNVLAGSFDRGIHRSTDFGGLWEDISFGKANTFVVSVSSIPNGKGGASLIAGTGGMGIYRSSDAGETWSPMVSELGFITRDEWGRSMAFDFNEHGKSYLLTGLAQYIGRSADSGKHWVRLATGLPSYMRILTLDTLSNGGGGTNIYAGTEVHGVYLSTDHGGTWNSTGAGLRDTSILDLAFLPGGAGGRSILAATEHGVFLSRNKGQSWNAMNNGMGHPAVPAIIVTPRRAGNGRNIFAGTRGTGVFRSTDDGNTWVATGLTNASISAFATVDDGVEGTILFAALADGDGGVFLSTDEGANWSAVSTGLRDIPVLSLCIALDGRGGRDLIAGTNGYGVWRRPLSDMVITDVRPPMNHPAAATLELSVQPNPAREQVLVRYDARGECGVLGLYNIYGARVLGCEARESGLARFDVGALPAGMYMLMLRSGAETATRRVMVVR